MFPSRLEAAELPLKLVVVDLPPAVTPSVLRPRARSPDPSSVACVPSSSAALAVTTLVWAVRLSEARNLVTEHV